MRSSDLRRALLATALGAVVGIAGAPISGTHSGFSAFADDPAPPPAGPPAAGPDTDEPDDPVPASTSRLAPEEAAKCKAEFDEALALQAKGRYATARKRLRALLERWPDADPALRREAEERSADNCFLGIEEIHHGGPSENRIDVELMGDGYLFEKQEQFKHHAEQQMKAFWAEPLYSEYESYFNVWRFDLVSKEEGVDDPGAGSQDAPPPPPDPTKRRKKKTRALKEYSTALNCQAAGPQRQVWADPDMVFKWRKYLKVSDGLSLCFAKKGELGMGGMGIATTGRLVAVVHEFGHAFVGLLDEYAINPDPPQGRISAPNAVSGKGPKEPPAPNAIPWKHWLGIGNKDVGVLLGGATYQQGVYRPAAACAMNSGGSSPYCWVCREKGVLEIYEYVNPIDEASPTDPVVRIAPGGKVELSVVPMAPKSHRLQTDWFLEKVKSKVVTRDDEGGKEPDEGGDAPASASGRPGPADAIRLTPDGFSHGPERGHVRHSAPWPPGAPPGEEIQASEKKAPAGAYRSTVVLENLAIGRYRVTARVRDDARVPNYRYPWVIKDRSKLLEERREWIVEVGDVAPAKPTAPAGSGGGAPPK